MITDAKKPHAMTTKIQKAKYVFEKTPAGVDRAG